MRTGAYFKFSGEFRPEDMAPTLAGFATNPDFFVLQIGAMDGVYGDPVHDALVQYGWPALLLEPQPEFFARLQDNYQAYPRVRCLCQAIALHTGTATLYRVPPDKVLTGELPQWMGGLASLYADRNPLGGQRASAAVGQFLASIAEPCPVPCSTLPDMIAEQGITHIDLLAIDAEGGDWMILRQFDLKRFAPKMIYFEFAHLPNSERREALGFLAQHNYRCFISRDRFDLLAVR